MDTIAELSIESHLLDLIEEWKADLFDLNFKKLETRTQSQADYHHHPNLPFLLDLDDSIHLSIEGVSSVITYYTRSYNLHKCLFY